MTTLHAQGAQIFSLHFYAQTVVGLLGQPRKFFAALPESVGPMQTLAFLIVSATFSTIAGLLNMRVGNVCLMGAIYLFNALGMVLVMAGLGYLVMALCVGKSVPFKRLFSIYALSAGVTLLLAWIPYFTVITEPWKWYLIWNGLTQSCGLKPKETLLIITLSLSVWVLFFWSLMPIITR